MAKIKLELDIDNLTNEQVQEIFESIYEELSKSPDDNRELLKKVMEIAIQKRNIFCTSVINCMQGVHFKEQIVTITIISQ